MPPDCAMEIAKKKKKAEGVRRPVCVVVGALGLLRLVRFFAVLDSRLTTEESTLHHAGPVKREITK